MSMELDRTVGLFRDLLRAGWRIHLPVVAAGGLLSACAPATPTQATVSPGSAPANATTTPYVISTIKELMDSTVDPSADGLWDAVSSSSTSEGVVQHQPRTEEDWKAVRRHAVTLIESMNLVVMPGRHAAPAGTKPGLGELEPAEIEKRIERDHAAFVALADGVRSSGAEALEAIDHEDAQALLTAGGRIDEACEACHKIFWYPDQKKLAK